MIFLLSAGSEVFCFPMSLELSTNVVNRKASQNIQYDQTLAWTAEGSVGQLRIKTMLKRWFRTHTLQLSMWSIHLDDTSCLMNRTCVSTKKSGLGALWWCADELNVRTLAERSKVSCTNIKMICDKWSVKTISFPSENDQHCCSGSLGLHLSWYATLTLLPDWIWHLIHWGFL